MIIYQIKNKYRRINLDLILGPIACEWHRRYVVCSRQGTASGLPTIRQVLQTALFLSTIFVPCAFRNENTSKHSYPP